jgi:hypothetical protein
MSFSPDRTANRPPRTCPSTTNHARRRLQRPLGAVAAGYRKRALERSRCGPVRTHSRDSNQYIEKLRSASASTRRSLYAHAR